ncbi:DUF262 domain-containing protein [Verticiella alkaliphila]|uniref:DUF262 domain-containing protein n=1 Tax=Verticiella alkaliphila TaxID=2779529 RepID=UPI001C0AC067|nr:DUF262 domain-containing protein [Verticiella sp. GG226]
MAASTDKSDGQLGPASLARRPEAKAFKIEDLLAEVRRGRVRIPTFQRDLKWERDDALKLMDSLYRGYPVGTLLLWEREASAEELVFQTVRISAAGRTDALWVVDGQQRIVSLIRVLTAPSEDGDSFALFFDLDQNKLLPPPRQKDRADDPARWLPLTVILDSERLMQWIFEFQPDAARRERAFQVGKRIREYEVPAYLVRSDSESTLREIFGRVNTAGKSLNVDEVFEALHGQRGAAVPSSIRDVATALLPHDFGRVDTKILHLVMSALEGVDSGRGLSEHMSRMSPTQVGEAFGRAAEVTGIVIRFLRESVGIPHYDLLPYKKPMVTLAKFFSYHPLPSPRSKELLTRWVWRGAMNGLHRGDTVSARAALASIRPQDEHASVRGLLEQIEGGAWPYA